jgi:hypothetical protein
MALTNVGLIPGLSSSDEINLVATMFIAATLIGVLWYAWEARKQATATANIADATFRPVLSLWSLEKVIGQTLNPYTLFYQNIGSGPALNIKLERDPEIGTWDRPSERVSMSTREKEDGQIDLKLGSLPESLIFRARYQDVSGCWWKTEITMQQKDGKLQNGDSHITRIGKTKKDKRP